MKDKDSKGTFYKKPNDKWEARIRLNPRTRTSENNFKPIDVSLGYYGTKIEARKAYKRALAIKYEWMVELAEELKKEFQVYSSVRNLYTFRR